MRSASLVLTLYLSAVPVVACHGQAASGGWRKSLDGVPIPAAPAAGSLAGEPFRVERATLNGGILTLRQGKQFLSDREVNVFTFQFDRPLAGQRFRVAGASKGFRTPHVQMAAARHWKGNVRQGETFMDGYSLVLELGKRAGSRVPGRIYLCFPDRARSWIAGTFSAEVAQP
jgi:hypothetical protein